MTCDFTGGKKRILKAAWLMEHEKSVGKAFCSFLLIFVAVACACKRIILGRKINNIRFMLIDLKCFPALLSSLLACNCQRGLGFYVRKTAQSGISQPPWGPVWPCLPPFLTSFSFPVLKTAPCWLSLAPSISDLFTDMSLWPIPPCKEQLWPSRYQAFCPFLHSQHPTGNSSNFPLLVI